MKKYKSHKIVKAFKILNIQAKGLRIYIHGSTPEETVLANRAYMRKHNPQVGGYFVKYEDGYASWSPADAFEKGYSAVEVTEPVPGKDEPTEGSAMEERAIMAYTIYRDQKGKKFRNGNKMPTPYQLFKYKKHEKTALLWLEAASKIKL